MNRERMAELHRHYVVWQDAVKNLESITRYSKSRGKKNSLFDERASLHIGMFDDIQCPVESMNDIEESLINTYKKIIADEEEEIDRIIMKTVVNGLPAFGNMAEEEKNKNNVQQYKVEKIVYAKYCDLSPLPYAVVVQLEDGRCIQFHDDYLNWLQKL